MYIIYSYLQSLLILTIDPPLSLDGRTRILIHITRPPIGSHEPGSWGAWEAGKPGSQEAAGPSSAVQIRVVTSIDGLYILNIRREAPHIGDTDVQTVLPWPKRRLAPACTRSFA